jgi:hypothetical protein
MNFFPQPCPAPSVSPKLREKQGHAKSPKVATDICLTKNNPFRLYPDWVGALRPLREPSVLQSPTTNLPLRPLRPLREPSPTPHAKSATFAKDFSDLKNNPFRPLRPLRATARRGNAGGKPSPTPHAKSATFAKVFSDL